MDQKHLGRSLEHLGLDGRLSLVLSEDNHLTLVEGEAGSRPGPLPGSLLLRDRRQCSRTLLPNLMRLSKSP